MMAVTESSILVQSMTQEDLPGVCVLEAEIFPDPWSRKIYEDTLVNSLYDCRVIRQSEGQRGRSVMGYLCAQVAAGEAELHRIAVHPEYRGRGYGQALLEDFLQRAAEAGAETAFLEVRAGNHPAISLYIKNGFVRLGVRTDYYRNPREDAVLFQRKL
jgi:ribosomal-protein-alanine N-acetyltransferase